MECVIVSPEYNVLIPISVRKNLGIKAGQKLQIIQYENRLELIPEKKIKEMRGFLRGINTTVNREKDRI